MNRQSKREKDDRANGSTLLPSLPFRHLPYFSYPGICHPSGQDETGHAGGQLAGAKI